MRIALEQLQRKIATSLAAHFRPRRPGFPSLRIFEVFNFQFPILALRQKPKAADFHKAKRGGFLLCVAQRIAQTTAVLVTGVEKGSEGVFGSSGCKSHQRLVSPRGNCGFVSFWLFPYAFAGFRRGSMFKGFLAGMARSFISIEACLIGLLCTIDELLSYSTGSVGWRGSSPTSELCHTNTLMLFFLLKLSLNYAS